MEIFMTCVIYASCVLGVCAIIWVAGKLAVMGMFNIQLAINSSKYAMKFMYWLFKINEGKEIPEAFRKRFLTNEQLKMVERMQGFIDTLGDDRIDIIGQKYSELECPLFIWHDETFCRSTGNDVISLENGRLGKIDDNEMVVSIKTFESIIDLCDTLDVHKKLGEMLDNEGW